MVFEKVRKAGLFKEKLDISFLAVADDKNWHLPAEILKELDNRVIVNIYLNGKAFKGSFKTKPNMYYGENEAYLKYNQSDLIKVRIVSYDKKHKSWNVVPIDNKTTQ